MQKSLGFLALSALAMVHARSASAMDVPTIKDKDGKAYFCANAKCAGNSECAGAGNATCGSQNKCSNTEQKYMSGWISAKNKAECEKDGLGKWMVYKKEYSVKEGNLSPFAPPAKATKKTKA